MLLRLNYGAATVTAEFRPTRGFVTELDIKRIATLQRADEIINQALDKPIGSHPFHRLFRGSGEVLIVVPDQSRRSGGEIYLPIIRRRLNELGISDAKMTILVATGSHPALSVEEMHAMFPPDEYDGIKIVQHDSRNKKELSYIGETKRGTPVFVNSLIADAEHIIICGTVVHHYFAGYGGGPKMIIPGCAGYETITRNHALAIDHSRLQLRAGCSDGKVDGNPLQQDLREAFKFINVTFLLHTILNGHNDIVAAFAGEALQAHAAGCRMVDDIYRVPIKEPADLVIVSCGGRPRDINYIQAHKSLHHAFYAVRQGGVIIFLANCAEGVGSQTFLEWFDYDDPEKLHHALIHHYKLNGTTALATMQKARECRIIAVTDLPRDTVAKLGFIPAASLSDALSLARKKLAEDFSSYIMPNGALTVPTLEAGES
jgi:nickel-dependent lactate racemase